MATFLPGSGKKFFTLGRYQEELGKDFKRIMLFLYTLTDFRMSEGEVTVDGEKIQRAFVGRSHCINLS